MIMAFSFNKLFPRIPQLPPKTQFIKLKFINQGLDLLNISNIFRDHRVASKIPQYFENLEPPLICYQYKKPLEISFSTTTKSLLTLMFRVLFNLLALVRTRHFCIHLQAMLSRGTFPVSLTRDYGHSLRKDPNTDFRPGLILPPIVEEALQTYCKRWCKKEGVGVYSLNDWKDEFLRIVDIRIENFTTQPHLYKQPPSRSVKALKRKMEKLHSKYVFAPADKAANNVIII